MDKFNTLLFEFLLSYEGLCSVFFFLMVSLTCLCSLIVAILLVYEDKISSQIINKTFLI